MMFFVEYSIANQTTFRVLKPSIDFDIVSNLEKTVKRLISKRSCSLKSLDSQMYEQITVHAQDGNHTDESRFGGHSKAVGETQTSLVHAVEAVGNVALLQS
ncbi:hypothetical protein DPMN_059924 [Dreissena polymorpha]|uniref:Uncharacterized protein n=1 Tax=Dreissena polymorpha TaxID=45954 RepID=A0A9D4C4T4_DREPO|nr:hypothetical protein DPMN_059924 [Dreissena polymorpha]